MGSVHQYRPSPAAPVQTVQTTQQLSGRGTQDQPLLTIISDDSFLSLDGLCSQVQSRGHCQEQLLTFGIH